MVKWCFCTCRTFRFSVHCAFCSMISSSTQLQRGRVPLFVFRDIFSTVFLCKIQALSFSLLQRKFRKFVLFEKEMKRVLVAR